MFSEESISATITTTSTPSYPQKFFGPDFNDQRKGTTLGFLKVFLTGVFHSRIGKLGSTG